MKYHIVYSITAHESIECIDNLYENIMKFNNGIDCLVIFHVNKSIYELVAFGAIKPRENLIFHPEPTEKKWCSSEIFLAHMANFKKVQHLDFNFFCTLASNCMFVKNTDYKYIEERTPELKLLSTTKYKEPKDKRLWFWPEFYKCEKIVNTFKLYDIEPINHTSEGVYIRKNVFERIYYFCEMVGINRDSFIEQFSAEEIILPSLEQYFTGSKHIRYNGMIHDPIEESDVNKIRKTKTHYNIVKRVPRDINASIRKYINNLK